MHEKIRWGILAPGRIAHKFAEGLTALSDAELVAVGSRSVERARQFAARFGAQHAYDSYEELLGDAEVDAVYVASPHPFHAQHSILSLNAGKAVLCEKPFTINASQAREVIDTARCRRVFCMEAMWTRFLPTMVKLRELLRDRVIGEARMLSADFGFRCDGDPSSRLMDLHLGGGGLLDVGVYPLSLAFMVFGAPERITGMAHIGQTGVDEQAAVLLGYGGGELAICWTAARTNTPQLAFILGSEGRIDLGERWWNGRELTVRLPGEVRTLQPPCVGNGYNYEAAEVGRCLRAGSLESDVMPLEESLRIVEAMDDVRAQWGLRYPME